MNLIGDVSQEDRQHAEECGACRAKIASLVTPLSHFRGAVRNWSDRAGVPDRAAELHWTVIPAQDHLGRLLLPAALDIPWYRSLWSGIRECFQPAPPPLDLTSKPVLVRNIWGQFGRQKKSWVMSVAMQSAIVLLVFTAAMTPAVQQKVVHYTHLIAPDISPYPKAAPQKDPSQGGGGGGDRSLLSASQGRLPKAALKQFTPPTAVVANLDPKLSMDPTIIAPPDVQLPDVKLSQYGDPLGRIGGPLSNGTGSGGGIGGGKGGGVGIGNGPGYGSGSGGGVSGGVYRVGLGVSAPSLLSKVEPEYSEEARKAKHQGTVLLYVEIDPSGHAQNVRVLQSMGLGLDEKAIEAVRKWKFRPGTKDGRPVTVAATIEVNFRLL